MNAIFIMFCFGIYGFIVLVFYWLYVKLFEKRVNAKIDKKQRQEQARIQDLLKQPTARDYDKEPIFVENRHKIKINFINITVFVPLFLYLTVSSLESQPDMFDEYIRKGALVCGIIGILGGVYFYILLFIDSKRKIYISIHDNYLICNDYKRKSNFSKAIDYIIQLDFNDKLEISYGFFPLNGETKNYKPNYKNFNDKFENIILLPLIFAFKLIITTMFFILNLFRFKKYYIFKNDKYIVSVEANKELKDRFGKVKFDILTLTYIM